VRDGKKIAAALGGYSYSKGWMFRCPCHDDRKPSASIRYDGLVTCFARCPREKVEAALDALGLTDDGRPARHAHTWTPDPAPEARVVDAMVFSAPIAGTLGELYLRSRGIVGTVNPSVLRFTPQAIHPITKQMQPAIIAAVTNDRLLGVQLTFLRSSGAKDIRHNAGSFGRGAVKLAEPANGELGLAEGTETALSATQLTGVPCWATLGALRMDSVRLPANVKRVHIFADNDEAGRTAVAAALRRYTMGRHVTVHWPPPQYKDWNDVLRESAAR
jgi:hypothetical protein